jgi:hypothetical protein
MNISFEMKCTVEPEDHKKVIDKPKRGPLLLTLLVDQLTGRYKIKRNNSSFHYVSTL